jgi:hypothetical protein
MKRLSIIAVLCSGFVPQVAAMGQPSDSVIMVEGLCVLASAVAGATWGYTRAYSQVAASQISYRELGISFMLAAILDGGLAAGVLNKLYPADRKFSQRYFAADPCQILYIAAIAATNVYWFSYAGCVGSNHGMTAGYKLWNGKQVLNVADVDAG